MVVRPSMVAKIHFARSADSRSRYILRVNDAGETVRILASRGIVEPYLREDASLRSRLLASVAVAAQLDAWAARDAEWAHLFAAGASPRYLISLSLNPSAGARPLGREDIDGIVMPIVEEVMGIQGTNAPYLAVVHVKNTDVREQHVHVLLVMLGQDGRRSRPYDPYAQLHAAMALSCHRLGWEPTPSADAGRVLAYVEAHEDLAAGAGAAYVEALRTALVERRPEHGAALEGIEGWGRDRLVKAFERHLSPVIRRAARAYVGRGDRPDEVTARAELLIPRIEGLSGAAAVAAMAEVGARPALGDLRTRSGEPVRMVVWERDTDGAVGRADSLARLHGAYHKAHTGRLPPRSESTAFARSVLDGVGLPALAEVQAGMDPVAARAAALQATIRSTRRRKHGAKATAEGARALWIEAPCRSAQRRRARSVREEAREEREGAEAERRAAAAELAGIPGVRAAVEDADGRRVPRALAAAVSRRVRDVGEGWVALADRRGRVAQEGDAALVARLVGTWKAGIGERLRIDGGRLGRSAEGRLARLAVVAGVPPERIANMAEDPHLARVAVAWSASSSPRTFPAPDSAPVPGDAPSGAPGLPRDRQGARVGRPGRDDDNPGEGVGDDGRCRPRRREGSWPHLADPVGGHQGLPGTGAAQPGTPADRDASARVEQAFGDLVAAADAAQRCGDGVAEACPAVRAATERHMRETDPDALQAAIGARRLYLAELDRNSTADAAARRLTLSLARLEAAAVRLEAAAEASGGLAGAHLVSLERLMDRTEARLGWVPASTPAGAYPANMVWEALRPTRYPDARGRRWETLPDDDDDDVSAPVRQRAEAEVLRNFTRIAEANRRGLGAAIRERAR